MTRKFSATERRSERLAAANAAAAAANIAAAAAAPAAASPTAAAIDDSKGTDDELPSVIPRGRFKGYISPSHFNSELEEWKRRGREVFHNSALRNFEEWQDEVIDGLPVHFMRWHKMMNASRRRRR